MPQIESTRNRFTHSVDQLNRFSEAQDSVKTYDVYKDFPKLDHLVEHKYTPSRILVTGVAGFIASHVSIRLSRLYPQYRVIGVDKISYCSDVQNVLGPLSNCSNFRFVIMDVCNYEGLMSLMKEEKIDTVLHLAAQSHVDLSFKEGGPRTFVRDNIEGTASILEAARMVGVKRFIYCSTDEVYGEGTFGDRIVFDETQKINPTNPYSATKAAADVLAQVFYKSFGFPVIITRGNNVYGPHQFYEKLIPKFITQLKMGRKITVHGNGGTSRNFLHVQDTASAFDAVLHCGELGNVYNIGGRNEKTVLDVAGDLLLIMGLQDRQDELVQFVKDRAHNDMCYPITNAKLCSLGWQEQLSWEFGLVNTATFVLRQLRDESRDLSKVLEAHPEHFATAQRSSL